MLSVNNLDIRYGEKHLFKNVSVQVYDGNRIGLVGVNGAGKSTLLKIMGGITGSDDGVVNCAKHFTVGYLPQESEPSLAHITLYEEAQKAYKPLLRMQEELDLLNLEIAETDSSSPGFSGLLERQGELQHQLDVSDLYAMRGRIEKVLLGLGFKQSDMSREVGEFSGGWQMRLRLARMLLEAPSLLLLDEPTNHLDLQSLTWLEQFLCSCGGAMVIISHDRTFLDRVTSQTWEISLGTVTCYKGNYSFYLQEKEERLLVERSAYENQQAKIKQTMRFVDRFRAKSTKAKQVQSRMKQLEKMELIELSVDEKQIHFSFPPAPPSGRDVLGVERLCKRYEDNEVFRDVAFSLQRGDKVAVVGVNGAGKTTLLRILAGELEHEGGECKFGTGVVKTYFGQHQAQELSPQLSALETMALAGGDMTVTRQRSLLGAFLFRGEEVEKKVAILSGGEKSRLALARMIATPANLMLLDEPTNHLDMSSQEVLQEAMAQYDGTVIVVSHNRYFLDSFVNKVFEVRDGQINIFEGNVTDYLNKLAEIEAEQLSAGKKESDSAKEEQSVRQSTGKRNRKEQKKREAEKRQQRNRLIGEWLKKSEKAEKHVEQLETEKEELEGLMADPALYVDEAKWAETSRAYEDCQRRLERWYGRWEEAQERIEEGEARLAAQYGEQEL